MSIQEREFARFIKLLDASGCLEHVIIVGSWAEYIYRELGMLEGFDPIIRTLDIDFLVRNMRRPPEPVSLASAAKEAGYLVESDRLAGTTKIMDKSGLEIEFLIGKMGAGVEPALKTNIGVTAQAVWHLDILSRNAVQVAYCGMTLFVPSPEAYAVHKMVINKDRKAKREKDAAAILGIWPFLDMPEVARIISTLSKRERLAVGGFCEKHHLVGAELLG